MTPAEATQVAMMIGELWTQTPMNDLRRTMYASALEMIPSPRDAVEALERLFLDEPFPPPPGMIVDLALGVEGRAIEAWDAVRMIAVERSAGRQCALAVPQDARAALRAIGVPVGSIPVDNAYQLEQTRIRFHRAYRDSARGAAQAAVAALEAPVPADSAPLRAIDTSSAAGRL